MSDLREGQLINATIRLDHILGRGGMGSLWFGYHLRLKVRVVVKFIASELAGNPEAMARFEREAAATMAAKSAHVVQILDYGFTDEMVPFIAMEYLEGEDLATKLARQVRISPWEFGEIIKQSCKGLTRAHAQGIIHRDIKPENIFLTYVDDELAVKLLDFGIAKADSAALNCPSTRTGLFLGTVYYMSPEQTMGATSVDHRTDLWALGVVAYYSLTGVLPFEGDAIGNLVEQITSAPILPPSHHIPSLGPAIDAWMRRALARDPNQRFATAKDMATAFDAAVAKLTPREMAVTLESGSEPAMASMVAVGRHPGGTMPLSVSAEQYAVARVSANPTPRGPNFAPRTPVPGNKFPETSAPPWAAATGPLDEVVNMRSRPSRTLLIGIAVGVAVTLVLVGVLSLRSSATADAPAAAAIANKSAEFAHQSPAATPPVASVAPASSPSPQASVAIAPLAAPSLAAAIASSTRAAPAPVVRRPPPAKPTATRGGDTNPFDGTY